MGATGFCKACSSPLAKQINQRLAADESLSAIVTWCKGRDFTVTRQTLARHKEHITDPRQTFVEKARRNPAIRNGVSNDEFLQAVIDAAAAKAESDPEAISVAHGLKAAQIRESRREKQTNVLIQIARVFTAQLSQPTELIEGSWAELPAPAEETA